MSLSPDVRSEPLLENKWYEKLKIDAIDNDSRRMILKVIKERYSSEVASKYLGIGRSSLYRYINGERDTPDEVIKRALTLLTEKEFEEIVGRVNKLKALGIIRKDGTVDYNLIMNIIDLAREDEYLKQLLLRFVTKNFREDLKKWLGVKFAGITLKWTSDFEHYLRAKKKKRINTEDTIKYYRNLFKKYLEGKELTEELVNYVADHPNGWLRNIFRHYIGFLFYMKKIEPDVFGWIKYVVPSRRYENDVRLYEIKDDDVIRTFKYLKKNHELYYGIYRLLLESGARVKHVLKMLELWSPDEEIELVKYNFFTKRLTCFEEKGFCRYFLGLHGSSKPCEMVYFSTNTLRIISKYVGKSIYYNNITKYARRHKLLSPKSMRKVSWRIILEKKVVDLNVGLFMHSRYSELKVSDRNYAHLVNMTDNQYPKYLETVNKLYLQKIED